DELRVRGEPRLGGTAKAALLLGADHLERVAVPGAALCLHLAEDQLPTAAQDQVDFVAADPDVPGQHAIEAQAVVPPCAPLGGPAGSRSTTSGGVLHRRLDRSTQRSRAP